MLDSSHISSTNALWKPRRLLCIYCLNKEEQVPMKSEINFSAVIRSVYSLIVLPCSCIGQNDQCMSTFPLHHSSVDLCQPEGTDRRDNVDNSSSPTCTQCIFLQRIQDGRSNSLYLSHTENLGLQWGCTHRAKKERNKEIVIVLLKKKPNKTKTQPKTNSPLLSIYK